MVHRWSNKMCGTKSKTEGRRGVVLEMVLRGEVFHVRAPLPDHDIVDLKAMAAEKYDGEAMRDAESLLAANRRAHRVNRDFIPTA